MPAPRINLRPSMQLRHSTAPRSTYVGFNEMNNVYSLRRPYQLLFFIILPVGLPYLSVQTYRWLDRLPFWEQRIGRGIQRRVAFDFMINSQVERD